MVDLALYLFYALAAAAVLAAFGFSIINAINKPGALIKSGITIAVLVVLFFLSYAISSGNVTDFYRAKGISEGMSKLIGAGLIMFYLAIALAFLALIFSMISKALK